jgi:DNA polymerase-3 subunit epsilon
MRTVYLDTETTGLRGAYAGGRDEIVELAILDNRGKPIINQLLRPTRRNSWPDAQRIHGISPAMVADAPTLEALLPEVSEVVRGCLVVIYNAFRYSVFSETAVS